jgi:hypothetical protein
MELSTVSGDKTAIHDLIDSTYWLRLRDKYDKDPASGCWIWRANSAKHGYGRFTIKRNLKRPKHLLAHRVSYYLYNGEFDETLNICHKCDNPRCVNPSHLFAGTQADNIKDMIKKGRHLEQQKTHCKRGHEFTPENIYWTGTNKKRRECLTCKRAQKRQWRARQRQCGKKVT